MPKMTKKILLVISLMAGVLVFGKLAYAATDYSQGLFDTKIRYDIFLRGNEDTLSVISNVVILRVEEILGRRFLVVRAYDFTLNSADGFVAFDTVQAILPNSQIKVKTTGKINSSY